MTNDLPTLPLPTSNPKEILPEVKAYWESLGYKVQPRMSRPFGYMNNGILLYDIVENGIIQRAIVLIFEEEDRRAIYYIGDRAFYDNEILKVLKLKAFL